jgi:hypothetical protein
MATFYLLPPRACLEQALKQFLQRFVPGLPLPEDCWDLLVERLAAAAGWPCDVFLITRDELPDDQLETATLMAAFGAEVGDEIVEVSTPAGSIRRFQLTHPAGDTISASTNSVSVQ